jgi:hypothetical protein
MAHAKLKTLLIILTALLALLTLFPAGRAQPSKTPEPSGGQLSCTLTITCEEIFDNAGSLDAAKADIVPQDGVMLQKTSVRFTPGETVFDVLKRVCEQKSIRLEYSYEALYRAITWKAKRAV